MSPLCRGAAGDPRTARPAHIRSFASLIAHKHSCRNFLLKIFPDRASHPNFAMYSPAEVAALRAARSLGGQMLTRRGALFAAAVAALAWCGTSAFERSSLRAQETDTERAIEHYRQMLKDDPWSNPGLLDVDRGETLWATPRGPK